MGEHILGVKAALDALTNGVPQRDWQQQLNQSLIKLLDNLENTRGAIRKALFFLLVKV